MHPVVQMVSFATVVEKGSFTAAAKSLGLSQSVVSKQVSQLEDQLSVRLLHRTTRRLSLTEAGDVYYQHCRRLVAEAREAEQAVAPLQIEPQGLLRITAPQCLALSLLPDFLPAFQRRYPKLEVETVITGRLVDLVDEQLDAGLRIGALQDSTLIARRLAPCPFVVVASPGYWQQQGLPKHPSDLLKHNCLVYSEMPRPGHWTFAGTDGEELMVPVNSSLRSDDAALLVKTALTGMGVMYGPAFTFAEQIKNGSLQPALLAFVSHASDLFVLYPHTQHVAPKTRALVDFLLQSIDESILDPLSGWS